jgi:hypothetical protein
VERLTNGGCYLAWELRDDVDNTEVNGRVAGLDRDKAGKADVSREALHWMTSMDCGIVQYGMGKI